MSSFNIGNLSCIQKRPEPQTPEEKEKLAIIDQICLDDTVTHCLPRLLLRIDRDHTLLDLLPRCPYFGAGCNSANWCPMREYFYRNPRTDARYLVQAKLIEREEWIIGVNEGHPETYHDALSRFAENGGGAAFEKAWSSGERDINVLQEIVVHRIIDHQKNK